MSRIKAYLAYGWAFLAAPLLLATFLGMEPLAKGLVTLTGLRVHPLYTGGEIARTISHGQYKTVVHRPVFDGLVGPRSQGFIQIAWQPEGAVALPERIDEQIDPVADGIGGLRIHLDTKTNDATLETSDNHVLSVAEVLTVENNRIVRINLKRP